jgi:norsolorinic acid ketoreductase
MDEQRRWLTSPWVQQGIGKRLVKAYLLRPHHTVVAAVRDPSHPTSKSLSALPTGNGSILIIVTIDASSDTSAFEAVKTLETEHSITSTDIIIANAAIGVFSGNILQTPLEVARDHYNINSVGPLALFQAVFPLLSAASLTGPTPKFVAVTSTVGSIGDMEKWPSIATAYGSSKAALNWLTKRIHLDYPQFIAFPIYPGYVLAP